MYGLGFVSCWSIGDQDSASRWHFGRDDGCNGVLGYCHLVGFGIWAWMRIWMGRLGFGVDHRWRDTADGGGVFVA